MGKRGKGADVIQVDWVEFEKLCALQCTQVEIAEWFSCSPDTIDRRVREKYKENFAEVFKKKSSKGKISLRRKMFELAMKGNVTMCIFLSKNILGFSDKLENVNQPIKTINLKYSFNKPINKGDKDEEKDEQ